jgi:hypothetical protein
MGIRIRIVKPSGKDTIDMRGDGPNKVAKYDRRQTEHAGRLTRLTERGQLDRNRRP